MFSKKWADNDLSTPVSRLCKGSGGGLYGGKMTLPPLQHVLYVGGEPCRPWWTRSSNQKKAPQYWQVWHGGPSLNGKKTVPKKRKCNKYMHENEGGCLCVLLRHQVEYHNYISKLISKSSATDWWRTGSLSNIALSCLAVHWMPNIICGTTDF